jgi:hypothetical protein
LLVSRSGGGSRARTREPAGLVVDVKPGREEPLGHLGAASLRLRSVSDIGAIGRRERTGSDSWACHEAVRRCRCAPLTHWTSPGGDSALTLSGASSSCRQAPVKRLHAGHRPPASASLGGHDPPRTTSIRLPPARKPAVPRATLHQHGVCLADRLSAFRQSSNHVLAASRGRGSITGCALTARRRLSACSTPDASHRSTRRRDSGAPAAEVDRSEPRMRHWLGCGSSQSTRGLMPR